MSEDVGVEAADLTPVTPETPETAEARRIHLESEAIRKQWREENGGE